MGDDVHLVHSTGRLDDGFARGVDALGGRVRRTVIEMRRAPHPSDLTALRKLRRYMRAHGPFDVVHGQSSKGGALARLVRSDTEGAIVYTPHCVYTLNPTIGRLKRIVYGRAELWLARRTDAVIAVSPSESDHLRRLGFPADRLHLVPNGFENKAWPARDVVRARLGFAERDQVVGFLGRLSPQKDPLLLIEAFAALSARHRSAVLAVAGDGELESEGRDRAQELGVADRVRWLGYVRPDEFLPGCDLFALSSRYEGMPYVYLEAMSCGLPIVSTNVGGSELAIEHGRNGLVVPRADVDALCEAIDSLLSDDERRAGMGVASRERSSRYSLQAMLLGTKRVYEASVMARSKRSPTHSEAGFVR